VVSSFLLNCFTWDVIFDEDVLRMLRCLRFCCDDLGFVFKVNDVLARQSFVDKDRLTNWFLVEIEFQGHNRICCDFDGKQMNFKLLDIL